MGVKPTYINILKLKKKKLEEEETRQSGGVILTVGGDNFISALIRPPL